MKINIASHIDGSTKIMGIIGDHLGHTKSPAMHNYAAAQLGKNCVYLPIEVSSGNLQGILEALWNIGCQGLNVTTPHKELVASYLNENEFVSVNTLKRGVAGFEGTSTDALGFVNGLNRIDRNISDFSEIYILGNGGATVALIEHFAKQASHPKITIHRRNLERDQKIQALSGDLNIRFQNFDLAGLTASLGSAAKDSLLIQATSAPIRGDDLEWAVPALVNYKGVVVDLVYGTPSKLYFAALANNLVAQDGEAMLIEQARASHMYWWHTTVSYDDLAKVLRGKMTK